MVNPYRQHISLINAEMQKITRDNLYTSDYSSVDWSDPSAILNPVIASGEDEALQNEIDDRIEKILKEATDATYHQAM